MTIEANMPVNGEPELIETAFADPLNQSDIADASDAELSADRAQLLKEREQQIAHYNRRRRFTRGIFGGAMLAAAAGYGGVALTGHADHFKVTKEVPFEQKAQDAINNFDPKLADMGEVMLLLGLGGVATTKLLSVRSKRLTATDEWSSQDMSADGIHQRDNVFSRAVRTGLRNTVAGRVPMVLAGGVMLGSMSSAIATAVTHGPEKAIQGFTAQFPGDSYVVEYPGDFTMTDGFISRNLANNIVAQANNQDITAVPFAFNLGQMTHGSANLSDLTLGVAVTPDSELYWKQGDGCAAIPVDVDKSAHLRPGTMINENGFTAEVVGTTKDSTSATNRIGIEMSLDAMGNCLEKSPEAPVTGVVIDAPIATAQEILQSANTDNEVATVITKQHYENNSNIFWDANVLPLISILELSSLALVGFYAQRASKEQIINSRHEWAEKSAAGTTDNIIRITEVSRAIKDGLAATAVGSAVTLATPLAVNALVSGINYSVGYRNLLVGAAIGVGGAGAGAIRNVIRPQKLVNVVENTRA